MPPVAVRRAVTARRITCSTALAVSPASSHTLQLPRRPLYRRDRSHTTAAWRPVSVLDEWVAKEARPISLRQLMVFGRSLTESRLINSANYVRTELPIRIAHRIRDMQHLPYAVVKNPHISDVYNLYYNAFDSFRKIKEINTLEENDEFCKTISKNLQAHLTVIPKLAMGIIECSDLMDEQSLDKFMNTILRSLSEADFIGEVFIKCVAKDVIDRCGRAVQALARATYGPEVQVPDIHVEGHLSASFPYILSHLEYIVGELLRNSVQAVIERQIREGAAAKPGADSAPAPTPAPVPPLRSPFATSPNLQLGMGLPLSRVYAEYWAGSLELHSLEGYGVDTFLQISRLGNKNEQLATRATIDAV
ncbi:unnamed protein product [Parascedosporium putredinis]|uniref:Protein-serine/threonine kinase n=1 Tax=Parascedosporium putredinis TaxID=1442378 RepID=A0A9P1GU91_9PEZI|nr:unnamed protein product [Parascedosporium putredinis]CAI7987426.1 unnamed protein product [Parascedosporium putredinis]